jgi:hypothetical protein
MRKGVRKEMNIYIYSLCSFMLLESRDWALTDIVSKETRFINTL